MYVCMFRYIQVFGRAVGSAPKDKVFKSYIELELQLGNIDRVRTIYEKQLETFPANCKVWTAFAELEQSLGDMRACAHTHTHRWTR